MACATVKPGAGGGGGLLSYTHPNIKQLPLPLIGGSSCALSCGHPFLNFTLKRITTTTTSRRRNASSPILPLIRAQTSSSSSSPPDYYDVPGVKFYKVEAILRPWRIPQVSSALLKMGIRGVTVSDVRGFGAQGGLTERQAGSEFSEDKFLAKVKMEIVVSKDQVESVIDKIIEEARTGEIGDGKIFVLPVSDVIRVRTGERGEEAERMAGGRAEITSSSSSSSSSRKDI